MEKGVLKASWISDGWWRFLAHNPSISLRSGDATANVRMEAVNEKNIMAYFDLLKEMYDKPELSGHPECIYNIDETGNAAWATSTKNCFQKGCQINPITYIRSESSNYDHWLWKYLWTSPTTFHYAAKQPNALWTRGSISSSRYTVSIKEWIIKSFFSFSSRNTFFYPYCQLPSPCITWWPQLSFWACYNQVCKGKQCGSVLSSPAYYSGVPAPWLQFLWIP